MAGPYTYAIGPVPEVNGTYQPPTGCISWIDLRSLGQQSALGQTGCGFFTMPSDWSVPGGYHGLGGGTGDLRELPFTLADQSAWTSLIGSTIPRDGATKLIDALRLQLTDYAVPDGSAGPKPLQPGTPPPGPPPEAAIYLGGHSRMWTSIAPRLGVGRWGKSLRDLIRTDLQRHADEGGPRRDTEHWRKVLGAVKMKYGVPWDDPNENDFLPPGLRGRPPANPGDPPGRQRKARKPSTRYDQDFNGADSATLPAGWTEDLGSVGYDKWEIVSNAVLMNGATYGTARYDSDVSSTDHECGATITAIAGATYAGPGARVSSSADTMYYAVINTGPTNAILKRIAGAQTIMATNGTAGSAGQPLVCDSNGSTQTCVLNGTNRAQATDTAISTGTRGGLFGYWTSGTKPGFDDWYVDDGLGSATPALLLLLGVG